MLSKVLKVTESFFKVRNADRDFSQTKKKKGEKKHLSENIESGGELQKTLLENYLVEIIQNLSNKKLVGNNSSLIN